MYAIMWNDGNNGTEEIDSADTREEAQYLKQEYQMAYKGYVWVKRLRE